MRIKAGEHPDAYSIHVFLNGKESKIVIEADDEEGWAETYVLEPGTKATLAMDWATEKAKTTIFYGKVEFKDKDGRLWGFAWILWRGSKLIVPANQPAQMAYWELTRSGVITTRDRLTEPRFYPIEGLATGTHLPKLEHLGQRTLELKRTIAYKKPSIECGACHGPTAREENATGTNFICAKKPPCKWADRRSKGQLIP